MLKSPIGSDPRQRTLRQSGRMANSRAASSRYARDESAAYEDWSKQQLYERAKELGILGRSTMDKEQLIEALRNH